MSFFRAALISLLSIALTHCAPAPAPSAGGSTAEDVKILPHKTVIRDFDNGLRLVVIPTDAPDIVSIQIPVQSGSRNEIEPGKSGFAHFFEHMMFRGSDNYSAEKYAEILKNIGADQNAYTTDDYTNYHITFTKDDLETVLMLEGDRFQNLKYAEAEFRTEALAVKGEYLKNYSNPIQKIFEVTRDKAFTNHTYKHTTMGFFKDIEDMPNQFDYAQKFFDRWYRPEKTTILLVGDVDPDNAYNLVKKYWGDWQRGSYSVDIPTDAPLQGPIYEHIKWDAPTQPWLVTAYRGPAFKVGHKALPAMDVVGELYFSEKSPLYEKLVVKEQRADQLFFYTPERKDPSLIFIAARLTDEKHAAPTRTAIAEALAEAVTTKVSERKVNDIKSRLKYATLSRLDSAESIAAAVAAYLHYDRDPATFDGYFKTLDAVTAADVQNYAAEFFKDSARVTVTLANSDKNGAMAKAIAGEVSIAKLVEAQSAPQTAAYRLMEQKSASPIIDMSMLFYTGSSRDPKGKKGLAALAAMMLTEGGSEYRTIGQLREAMFPLGAEFGHQLDKEMLVFRGKLHRDHQNAFIDIVGEQFFNPGFREGDFKRIKTQLINAIRTDLRGNNDEELGKEVLYGALYGAAHPYGHLNLGDVKDIEKITLDDVKNFYKNELTQRRLLLGIAGDYDDAFLTALKNQLGKLAAGNDPGTQNAERQTPTLEGYRALIVKKETPATAVSFGFPITVTRGHPDWPALWLVRSWLGEHRSFNSHLYQRIREARGMNYGDYAYIEYFPRGMYQFHPDTNLGRDSQIFQVWIRPLRTVNDAHFATRTALYEMQKLVKNGLSEEEFNATRNYLDKFVTLLAKTQAKRLGYAIDSDYYGTKEFVRYVRNGLKQLTLHEVNRVIKKHLQTDNLQFVFITKDADDLQKRLVANTPSPITYNSPKAQEIVDEDKEIETLELPFTAKTVRIIDVDGVFEGRFPE